MKKVVKKRKFAQHRREAWTGIAFISPWIIGFVFLFARPLIMSLKFAFHKVNFTAKGITMQWFGIRNFLSPFDDINFVRRYFRPGLTNFLYVVPLAVIFSLFVAVILNQKFRGRTFARALFFLPVIIASGVVIQMLRGRGLQTNMWAENVYVFNSGGVAAILATAGLPRQIIRVFTEISNRIYDIVWVSGVQILLYLAGLQSIPSSEYEAAKIEGATGWECFWKITWPRISPMTLVVVVYSVIDAFTNVSNPLIKFIYEEFTARGNAGASSAMAWLYFVIIFAVVIVIETIISRYVFYVNEN